MNFVNQTKQKLKQIVKQRKHYMTTFLKSNCII